MKSGGIKLKLSASCSLNTSGESYSFFKHSTQKHKQCCWLTTRGKSTNNNKKMMTERKIVNLSLSSFREPCQTSSLTWLYSRPVTTTQTLHRPLNSHRQIKIPSRRQWAGSQLSFSPSPCCGLQVAVVISPRRQ